jgi:hypothetical protein
VRVAVKPLPHVPFVVVLTIVIITFGPLATSTAVGVSKLHGNRQFTVLFGAQVMVGGVVSRTVTVCAHVTLLLQLSASSHVRVALKVFPQNPLVLVTVLTMRKVRFPPLHTSVPLGGSKFHGVPSSTVLFGAHVATGGTVSTMRTTCVQVSRLLQPSSNSQMRVAVVPHAMTFVTVLSTLMRTALPKQLSVGTGGSKFHAAPHCTFLSPAQVTTRVWSM